MARVFRQFRRRFYAGPRDLGIRPFRRGGYQSPTLTALLWGYALVARHLTLPARIVFICSGVIFPYAMLSLLMPIHILAFAILGLFVFDLAAGLAGASRFEVSRQAPPRMGAGTSARFAYTVSNRSRRPALDVAVDTLPLPAGLHWTRGNPLLETLQPGETVTTQAWLTAARRGEYTLPAVRADSAFPFHLWRWGRTCGEPQRLLVYPGFTPLRRLDLPVGLRYQPGGISLSSKVGESMEFLGCREFRDGDNPRRIHWRSWARLGCPVVKEFREEYLCRAALVLDTAASNPLWLDVPGLSPPDPGVEAAVSLTAAAADFLARRDFVIDLFAAGPEIYRFQGGRSLAYLDNMLDILACVRPHPGEPFAELIPVLVEEIAHLSSALVILVRWNERRRELLQRLAAAGVRTRALLVTAAKRPPKGLPGDVTLVRASDVVAGRCTSI
ncbi:MAG: DUF58 domain-containing protein [Kiritimatiellaeota bacterium]|nr:DUF58 domain-containing protein [Kiritimatiellota bacterium]